MKEKSIIIVGDCPEASRIASSSYSNTVSGSDPSVYNIEVETFQSNMPNIVNPNQVLA